MTHQILTVAEYQHQQTLLRRNLLKDPQILWQQAKEEWQSIPPEDSDPNAIYEVAAQPQNVDEVEFAPKKGQSLALAYEDVMRSIRGRQSRHRQPLRKRYKEKLERALFDGVSWNDQERRAFLLQWQENFFGQPNKRDKSRPGRWAQCEGLDRYTEAKFIKHFVESFVRDPSDKKAGETVCILWLLIWAAQEDKSDSITLQQVLNVSSQDIVSDDAMVKVGAVDLDISWGLHQLLCCLCGKGTGVRSRRLFENMDRKGKALERTLHDASTKILGEDSTPVLPTAFLVSPHLYRGKRISAAQRKAMKNARQIVPLRHTHKEVKAVLRKMQE